MENDKKKEALQFVKDCGIKIALKFDREDKFFSEDEQPRKIFVVELTRGECSFMYEFGLDPESSKNKTVPSTYDILESFNPYLFPPNLTLKGFAEEYGLPYETKADQKAVKTEYALAKLEWKNIVGLFGNDYRDLLRLVA